MNKRRKQAKLRWVQDETKKLIQIPTIKHEHEPTSLRALEAERAITKKLPLEEPVKHWQTEKAKRGVTDKLFKSGWWRLKPQRKFKVTSTELR